MADRIFEGFLVRQHDEGVTLAKASDLLELFPLGGSPPTHYVARLRCKGLIQVRPGVVAEANCFEAGIWFPPYYLRRADAFQVVTWLAPQNIWHPNVSDRAPFICVGKLSPGTPLVDLLCQVFEIVTYNKVTMREDDALNKEACAWARKNQGRFPIDRRPLKRRALALEVNHCDS